jgi:hypothetical protein
MIDPAKVDPWSRTTAFLTLFHNNQELASASGVLIVLRGQSYLLTALHNLTGREPDGRPKHASLAVPSRVRIEAFYYRYDQDLYLGSNEPDQDPPAYLIHPSGSKIDLVLLPLDLPVPEVSAIPESFLDPRRNDAMRLYVSQDCHIIGFPEGLVDKTNSDMPLPIWKTGHIASEPDTNFQGEPVVIVDSTTRPGMSGAPVIIRMLTMTGAPFMARLVGIYAGRIGIRGGVDSALGKVFKPHLVAEILAASKARH